MEKEPNNNNFVAAIDIGTTKIVAIVGQRLSNGKLKILGMSKSPSKGVKRGVVVNVDDAVSSIQTAVEAVQLKSGVMFSDVFVGIAGMHIRSIVNRGYILRSSDDVIRQEDMNRLIDDMYKIPIEIGEEIIHVLPQSFTVDNETGVTKPVGMAGRRLEGNFHIVIGKIATAKNLEKCVNNVGLKVKSLILEPLASSRAVLTEDEKEAGVALVDIGGGTTDVAIYYDNIIRHTAVIPFGGNVITNDIKEGCSILQREAEQLKIQYGSALGDIAPENKVVTIPGISGRDSKEISFRSLAYIIQSRMEEIIESVAFEIDTSGCFDKLGAGIVLTGGGAMLRHLQQLVKFRTGFDVKIGYPYEKLISEIDEDMNHPMYSTAIGLLLEGLDYLDSKKEKIETNKEKFVVKNNENAIERKAKKSGSMIDNIKNAFNSIFSENDAEM